MPQLKYTSVDFLKGVKETEQSDKGFFSPTTPCDIFRSKGALYPKLLLTDASNSTTLSGKDVIGIRGIGADIAAFASGSSTSYGYLYSLSIAGAVSGTDKDETANYTAEYCHIIVWRNKYYISSKDDIVEATASLGTVKWDWFTATCTGTHPALSDNKHEMCVYDNCLYIMDGQYVYRIDSASVSTLMFDAGAGKYVRSIESFGTYLVLIISDADTDNTPCEIVYWDGINVNNTIIKRIPSIDPILAVYNFGGELLLFLKTTLSTVSGEDVISLFKYTTTGTVYKNSLSEVNNVLYFKNSIDKIMTYDRVDGYRRLSYYYVMPSNAINCFYHYNSNLLLLGAFALIKYASVSATDTNANTIKFPEEFIGQQIIIRDIHIKFLNAMSSGVSVVVGYYNKLNQAITAYTFSYATHGAVISRTRRNINRKTSDMQWFVTITGGIAIEELLIDYEPISQPAN